MARKSTLDRTEGTIHIVPPGVEGLDMATSPILLPLTKLQECWNARTTETILRRRYGCKRVAILNDPATANGSKVFGAVTKYGKVLANAELRIPVGGMAVFWRVTAVRPSAGRTAFINANRQIGVTYGVVWLTLSDAGVPTAWVRWDSGATSSIVGAAISADGAVALLLVYDPDQGTLTLYADGDVTGAPITGLAATLQPSQATGVDWYIGAEYDPSAVGFTANSHFSGAVDSFVGLTLRGKRISTGPAPLLTALRKWSMQDWPNPQSSMTLWHYGFDEATGTVMKDSSRHKNHGTYTGAYANAAAVALPCNAGNFAGVIQSPDGKRTNVVAAGGQLFSEVVRGSN